MRKLLTIGAIASMLFVFSTTGAEALPGNNNATVTGRAEKLSDPHQIVASWRIIDPDPFSDIVDVDVTWGDGSVQTRPIGTPLLCGTVLTAAGMDYTLRRAHSYRTPGTYLISITIKTQQNVCGATIDEIDTASYQFEMTVE